MDFASQPRSGGSMVAIDFRFRISSAGNAKQCGNRFSDEMPDVIFVAVTDLMARSRILISAD